MLHSVPRFSFFLQMVAWLIGFTLCGIIATVPIFALGSPTAIVSSEKDTSVHVLPNGLRYVVLERRSPRPEDTKRVSFRMRVGGGWLAEAADERGLSHMIEHMMLEGTHAVSASDLVAMRDQLIVPAEWGATTAPEATDYFFTSQSNNPESVERLVRFLRGVASDIAFSERAIDRQRGIVLHEMTSRAAENEAYFRRARAMAPGSALDLVEGFRSPAVPTAKPSALNSLYRRIYRPERILITVVGDVDANVIGALIRKHFSSWDPGAPPAKSPPRIPLLTAQRHPSVSFDASPTGPAKIFLSNVQPHNPDAVRRGSRIADRLVENIVNHRLAIRAIDAGLGRAFLAITDGPATFRMPRLEGAADDSNWRETLSFMLREHALLMVHGVSPREFKAAKQRVLRELNSERAYLENAGNSQTAARIEATLVNGSALISPAALYRRDEALLRDLDLRTVNDVWRRMWGADKMHVRVETRALASVEKPLALVTQIVREERRANARRVKLPPAKPVEALSYRPAQPGSIAQDQLLAEGVRRIVFENGVTLNLVNRAHRGEWLEIAIRIVSPDTRAAMNHCDAIAAPAMFDAGGTGLQSAAEIREALSDSDIRFAPVQTSDTGIAVQAAARAVDFDAAVLALYARISDPGFRDSSAGAARTQLRSLLHRSRSDPVLALWSALEAAADQSARPVAFDERCIEGATMNRSRAQLEGMLAAGRLEIAIAGDFEPETVVATVASTFGAQNRRQRAIDPSSRRLLPQIAAIEVPAIAGVQKSYGIAWRVPSPANVREKAVQQTFAMAFSRLIYRRWVELDNVSYAPRVELARLPHPFSETVLIAGSAVASDRLTDIERGADEVVAQMKAAPITDDILEVVRRRLLDELRRSYHEDREWAQRAARLGENPTEIREWRELEQALEAVTSEEVKQYSARIFSSIGLSINRAKDGELNILKGGE